MTELLLQIDGMTCGSCAARVDKALNGVPGVNQAAVNLTTGMARVKGELEGREQDLLGALVKAGYRGSLLERGAGNAAEALRQVRSRGEKNELHVRNRLIAGSILGVPAVTIGMLMHSQFFLQSSWLLGRHGTFMIIEAILSTLALAITGWPFAAGAWRALRHGSANMDVLVALGAGVAWAASVISLLVYVHGDLFLLFHARHLQPVVSEFHAAVAIVLLITLGKYLESRAKHAAASAVGGLAAETAQTATRILAGGAQETVPAEAIAIGDRVQVLAHQKIPVDGVVMEGAGSADLSVITGESVPAEIRQGVALPGGATLSDGRIILRATATANASTVARIMDLVNSAQASKTQIQGLADRIAGVFVPIVIVIAAITFLGWTLLGHGWQNGLIAAIATIVIACPCAMGLATPTAITVALGTAAKRGILFTRAAALERAGKISTVVFDKTGTLTEGKPAVSSTQTLAASGLSPVELLGIAASLEQFSDHPLAQAVVQAAQKENLPLQEPAQFGSVPGGGVRGTFAGGREFAAGSVRFLESIGASAGEKPANGWAGGAGGETVVAVADVSRKTIIGVIGLRDSLRPDALDMLRRLNSAGKKIVVLSGDSHAAVAGALQSAQVDLVRAGVTPEGKAQCVRDLKSEGALVAFVGDGVNDGPALAAADLGIAMAGGTDLAKSAGDVLLVGNRIAAVSEVLEIAHRTLRIIRQNLFWAFAYNVAAIPLAMFGILPPGIAAGAMMASSLTVVGNALRLRKSPAGVPAAA